MFIFAITSLISVPVLLYYESQTGVTPPSSQNASAGGGYFLYFLLSMLLFTAVIIFLSRRKKTGIFRYLFGAAMALAIFYMASIVYVFAFNLLAEYVNIPLTSSQYEIVYEIAVLATAAIFFYVLTFRQNWIAINFAGVMASSVLAIVWSQSLGLYFAILLLVVVAVYDYIAVFVTKHMVELANASLESMVPLFFIMPSSRHFDSSNLRIEGGSEERGAILLGFGDVAIPNIMIMTSFSYFHYQIFPFLILPLLGGLAAMVVLFTYIKRPAPGLPFLNTGVLLGFGAALLINML